MFISNNSNPSPYKPKFSASAPSSRSASSAARSRSASPVGTASLVITAARNFLVDKINQHNNDTDRVKRSIRHAIQDSIQAGDIYEIPDHLRRAFRAELKNEQHCFRRSRELLPNPSPLTFNVSLQSLAEDLPPAATKAHRDLRRKTSRASYPTSGFEVLAKQLNFTRFRQDNHKNNQALRHAHRSIRKRVTKLAREQRINPTALAHQYQWLTRYAPTADQPRTFNSIVDSADRVLANNPNDRVRALENIGVHLPRGQEAVALDRLILSASQLPTSNQAVEALTPLMYRTRHRSSRVQDQIVSPKINAYIDSFPADVQTYARNLISNEGVRPDFLS